jgi:broad specificity phosphatase PhoE
MVSRVAQSHPPDAAVLCVSHSATATALIKHVLGLAPGARRSFEVRNLALNEIYLTSKGWLLRTLGDTAHLEGAAPPAPHGGAQPSARADAKRKE